MRTNGDDIRSKNTRSLHDSDQSIARNRAAKENRMNKDQVNGKWEQIMGRAKKAWGELTDDDFKKAEGSVDKLYGVIQERFGDTKEAIKAKLDQLHL
jgi:uncharacterized protein YjbJ (UPF0337 family)